MKFNSLTLVIGCLVCFIAGCKYDEGPWISLRSACARVEGEYNIVKFEIGGADSTSVVTSQTCYGKIKFVYNGKNQPNDIFMNLNTQNCKSGGSWSLSDKNNHISLRFLGNFIGIIPFGNGNLPAISVNYNILKLTDDEMKISTTYNNLIYTITLEE
jgi:hypothetical protein